MALQSSSSSSLSSVNWSDLPGLVLAKIADKIGPKIGELRLQSVCSSWRSSLSPLPQTLPFPLTLPYPNPNPKNPNPNLHTISYSLIQRIVFRIFPGGDPDAEGWLIKLEETSSSSSSSPNTFSLYNPVLPYSYTNDFDFSGKLPPPINLLNYGVSHVADAYAIYVSSYNEREFGGVLRVASASDFIEDGDFVVLALFQGGKLGFWKLGQDMWTIFDCSYGSRFVDLILFRGKFYVVDEEGILMMIDSSLKPVKIAPANHPPGDYLYLVEFDGDLLCVSIDLHWTFMRYTQVAVWVLNERERCWDRREDFNFNGRSLLLGQDVKLSPLPNHLIGCREVCIYFEEKFFKVNAEEDARYGNLTSSFDPRKGGIVHDIDSPEHAKPFWPPPTWLL